MGLGTYSFSATATDRAGNVATASGSFTVTVTPAGLCNLTGRYVKGSARYQGMKAHQQASVDKRVAAVCEDVLAQITPGVTPVKRKALINRYKGAVGDLAADGLLTQGEAARLSAFASAL